MKKRKAQFNVITAILLLLLIIAVAIIVWNIINYVIKKSAGDIEKQSLCLLAKIDIEKVRDSNKEFVIRRLKGGELKNAKVKLIVDGGTPDYITKICNEVIPENIDFMEGFSSVRCIFQEGNEPKKSLEAFLEIEKEACPVTGKIEITSSKNIEEPIDSLLEDTSSPQIISVKVGSTEWAEDFRNAVDLTYKIGYTVNTGSNQFLTMPWSNINQLFIQFSKNVESNSISNNIRLSGVNKANYKQGISDIQFNSATNILTIKFACFFKVDKLLLTIDDRVTDTSSNSLDGEWSNGNDNFPSGDGQQGGRFNFRINVLPGDTNRNGFVAVNDNAPLRGGFRSNVGDENYNIFADLDGSGSITFSDVTIYGSNLGKKLPSGEPEPITTPDDTIVSDGSVEC